MLFKSLGWCYLHRLEPNFGWLYVNKTINLLHSFSQLIGEVTSATTRRKLVERLEGSAAEAARQSHCPLSVEVEVKSGDKTQVTAGSVKIQR